MLWSILFIVRYGHKTTINMKSVVVLLSALLAIIQLATSETSHAVGKPLIRFTSVSMQAMIDHPSASTTLTFAQEEEDFIMKYNQAFNSFIIITNNECPP